MPARPLLTDLLRVALLLGGVLLLTACDRTRAGADAYARGDFDAAHQAFSTEVETAGDDASPELRFSHALAALRVGDVAAAAESIDAASDQAPDDPEVVALIEFLAGNVAYAVAEQRAAEADTPEAEPFAFDAAIEQAEAARSRWITAATSREDWPAARRNVERANRYLEDLARRRAEAEKAKRKDAPDGPPRIRPRPAPKPEPTAANPETEPPEPPKPGGEEEPATDLTAQLDELDPAAVSRLLETLAAKERERRAAREARQRKDRAKGSRDW